MIKDKKNRRNSSRLDRLERKCDRILSELIILRQKLDRKSDIDEVIDRLHRSARRMRMQAARERDLTKAMLRSSSPV